MNEIYTKEGSWDIFEQQGVCKTYHKNNMIYWQGEQAECFYYLKNGGVKIFLSSENGTEKTLTLLKPGTLFGEAAFFDGLPRISSAKAMTEAQIISIDRAGLMHYFVEQPELAMDMLAYLAKTVRMLSSQVDNMTFLQADKRIAQLLLHLAGQANRISTTHEEIANLAGTSRVTVSKILNQFVKNGWVDTQYRTIVILEKKQLRQFANL